jgi:hypothetical protein
LIWQLPFSVESESKTLANAFRLTQQEISQMKNSIYSMLEEFGASLDKQASIGDDAPDGTRSVTEGARSKENTSDVKENVVVNVEETPSKPGGDGVGGNLPTNSIGTKKDETGENVPSTKTSKDDPGTTHPAKAGVGSNRPSGGGEKSAADMDLLDLANDILAGIAVTSHDNEKRATAAKQASEAAPAAPAATPENKGPQADPSAAPAASEPAGSDKLAAAAGNATPAALPDEQLGFLAGQFLAEEMLKAAGNRTQSVNDLVKVAEQQCHELVARADRHTTMLVDYLKDFSKQADMGMGSPPPPEVPAGDIAGAGGPPPMGGPPRWAAVPSTRRPRWQVPAARPQRAACPRWVPLILRPVATRRVRSRPRCCSWPWPWCRPASRPKTSWPRPPAAGAVVAARRASRPTPRVPAVPRAAAAPTLRPRPAAKRAAATTRKRAATVRKRAARSRPSSRT